MSDPRETVSDEDTASRFCRRRFGRLLAATLAGASLGLRTRQDLAARQKRRRRWPAGSLHQHKDNPTAHPSHPFHRISRG